MSPYFTRYQVALYREAPGERTERNEFFNINVEPLYVAGVMQPGRWIVKERHGWWNEQSQRAEVAVVTLGPTSAEHAYNEQGAITAAKEQTGRRASEGFGYAAQPDPTEPSRFIEYRADARGNLQRL